MKKLVSLMLVMLMTVSCLVLVSCGGGSSSSEDLSSSKYVGTWKATKGVFKDEDVPIEEVLTDTNGVYILDLREDGTCTVTYDKEDTGTWTDKGDAVHIKATDTDTDFKLEGENLYVEFLGFKIIFEKQ